MHGALLALRAELLERQWWGCTEDWGGFVGRVLSQANPFPSVGSLPCRTALAKGRIEPAPGVNLKCVCSISLADAEQAQLCSGAEGIGSSWR